ncbi:hypothetical protein HPP92_018859 [Vanilla planifolia]|uniref:Fe2OG dioxygenase domain-containing protein n=1 Tax=Vanilla planifolia TaxID=51239 RepID=A0A835QCV0_VANPL|nr:hypothetical protein HPP92_018859 [Vanilla planifolia]
MRLNVYHFNEESIGLEAAELHTDSGLLTVLLEGEIGGLEILDQTGKFVAVHPQPGTFLVFMGDVGKHRVVCTQAAPRVSIAFGVLSQRDGMVEPQAPLVDEQHPRLYRSFLYDDYRKLGDTTNLQDGNALSLLRADE